jgi:site-specific DNA recombinase
MRAALYARYSTELQRKESIDDQLQACRRVAELQGFEVVGSFTDAAISGGTAERPGYQALLSAARAGTFDVIVAEDISRLWRNRAEFGPRSAELEDLGVQLLTCVGDDTRRDGYGLMISLKAAMAEQYRREVSYRTRRGMEGLARAGKSTGGRLYGYGPDKGEGAVVARVFRDRLAGASVGALAASLNREGIPAPRGPRWSYNAVKRLLSNPRYAGQAIWGKTQSGTRARDGGRRKPVARPEGPLVTRKCDAIVTPEAWAACNPGRAVV